MGRQNKKQRLGIIITIIFILGVYLTPKWNLNGVTIYKGPNSNQRHISKEGYNLGLKWQCVEFVKRYYYEHYNHKMPNTYGHAKDFFNKSLQDIEFNVGRGLVQYRNNKINKIKPGDILVFDRTKYNPYGHVAIAGEDILLGVIVYEQNNGFYKGLVNYDNKTLLGWLRLKN